MDKTQPKSTLTFVLGMILQTKLQWKQYKLFFCFYLKLYTLKLTEPCVPGELGVGVDPREVPESVQHEPVVPAGQGIPRLWGGGEVHHVEVAHLVAARHSVTS